MLRLVLLLNQSWRFCREKGGIRDSSSAFDSALGSPALIWELLSSLLTKLCMGFRDLLEICCEAFCCCFVFLCLELGCFGRQKSWSSLSALEGWFASGAKYQVPSGSRG